MGSGRIERIVELAEGPTVLDLGAVQHDAAKARRDDWLHAHLVREFDRVIGVDFLESAVDELNAAGYDIRCANVETMDLGIEADTVVAGELIEHIANPGLMLARVHEHLKPGGQLILTTPNPWAIVHLRRWLFNDAQINGEHVAWYGPVVLQQLLARYDFTVTLLETCGPPHPGLTGVIQRLDIPIFGGTTWVCVAERQDTRDRNERLAHVEKAFGLGAVTR